MLYPNFNNYFVGKHLILISNTKNITGWEIHVGNSRKLADGGEDKNEKKDTTKYNTTNYNNEKLIS